MVDITLTNYNKQSTHQQAVIHLETGTCVIDNKKKMSLKEFLNSTFEHPLMTQPVIEPTNGVYHLEYEDMGGFFEAPGLVYATLLHATQPKDCRFKINPSSKYQTIPFENRIYFSIDKDKPAEETISIRQLEYIIHKLYEQPFHFSEDLLLKDEFKLSALPEAVNGDDLYKMDERLLKLLMKPISNSRYELRYLNPTVGLGVFTRKKMKKNTIVSTYTGVKTSHEKNANYAFCPQKDCFNMHTSARELGNICRFINHAPNKISLKYEQAGILKANLVSECHYLNGQQILVYRTTRDIAKGEQLLIDYGDRFFIQRPFLFFNKENFNLDRELHPIDKRTPVRIYHLRVMAHYGVKKAQTYLLKRTVSIFILMGFILFCSIKALSFL